MRPVVLVVVELLVAAYVAFVVGLMSVWPMGDHEAFTMSDTDWWIGGACRAAIASILATVFFFAAKITNRRVLRLDATSTSRMNTMVPLLLAACIACAGIGGAVLFVITKPYL